MSGSTWQLQEAKNRFSELVDLAVKNGAQTVTKHGRPTVVVISVEDYEKSVKPKRSLLQALRECPVDPSEWMIERSKEIARRTPFDP
jgi:prevent-host-death family protein